MKTKTTYTPGPWRVGDAGLTVFGPPNGTPAPEIIAPCRSRANARLIAASPDLLGMLYKIKDAIASTCKTPNDKCLRCDIMNLIAKAEGGK